MKALGDGLMIVAALLILLLALASGYIPFLLMRQPRRKGESVRVSMRLRHHLKITERLPDGTMLALLLVGGVGWLLTRYG